MLHQTHLKRTEKLFPACIPQNEAQEFVVIKKDSVGILLFIKGQESLI